MIKLHRMYDLIIFVYSLLSLFSILIRILTCLIYRCYSCCIFICTVLYAMLFHYSLSSRA
nr:MAG TPA: protein of unknown function (DUF4713) [Bacteriophage sp.]